MTEYAIQTKGLTRYYGVQRGIRDLDLAIPRGSIFALVGENGAGKTTAMKIMVGLMKPDRGTVTLLGEDPQNVSLETKRKIAFLSEDQELFDWMTVERLIKFNASFYPDWDSVHAEKLIAEFELDRKARIRTLSRGQKRRVGIVLALAQNADLLILDEPASGLDTRIRRKFMDKLIDLVQDGDRSILISSHILGDLERVSDRLALIQDGSIRISEALDTLREKVKQLIVKEGPWVDDIKKIFNVLRDEKTAGRILIDVADFSADAIREMPGEADLQVVDLSLEDLFLALLGKD